MDQVIDPVREYLVTVTAEQQTTLLALRKAILAAAPGAEECISYRIPAFRFEGKVLVGYGATAKHCALYLFSGSIVELYAKDLEGFDTSKGTIRFPVEKPLSAALVKKLVKARIAEIRG